MPASPKAQEPSMEEILASIRRIIADDDPTRPGAEPVAPGREDGAGRAAGPAQAGPAPAAPRMLPPLPMRGRRPEVHEAPGRDVAYGGQGAVTPPSAQPAVDHGADADEPHDWADAPQSEPARRRPEAWGAGEGDLRPQPRPMAARRHRDPLSPARPHPNTPSWRTEAARVEEPPAAEAPQAAAPWAPDVTEPAPARFSPQPAAVRAPVAPSPAVGARSPEPAEPVTAPATARDTERPAVPPIPVERAPLPRRDLLSPAVDAAVASAFKSLGDLVLPQQERTVEDLVKEILRPMLKEWLDQNLAGIVERAVRAEIERVTSTLR